MAMVLLQPSKSYDDESWTVEIYRDIENLPSKEVESESSLHGGVCISRVPESLRSSNPQAFTPKFVGLGPYHHFRDDLRIKYHDKLSVAHRCHNILPDTPHLFKQLLTNYVSDSHNLHSFYASDVKSAYTHHTLLYVLTIDGFFLLAILHLLTQSDLDYSTYCYFLTGTRRTPLLNQAAEELTKDVLIREVFMLENQIPTNVLTHIRKIKKMSTDKGQEEIQQLDEHQLDHQLGSIMLDFCQQNCPFVNLQTPSKSAEKHRHLLHLMYRLIVPDPLLQAEVEAKKKADQEAAAAQAAKKKAEEAEEAEAAARKKKAEEDAAMAEVDIKAKTEEDAVMAELGATTGNAEEEPLIATTGKPNDTDEKKVDGGTKGQSSKPLERRCCFKCCSILCNILYVLIFIGVMVYIVGQIILTLLWWILYPLYRLLKFLKDNSNPFFKWLHRILSEAQQIYSPLQKFTAIAGNLEEKTRKSGSGEESDQKAANAAVGPAKKVMIPSVTELDKAGITFKPTEGDISKIEFNEDKCEFYLPTIKVDGNSEVIMRNLMAYETWTTNGPLIFSKYIELMRAIIDTEEDVKILARKGIIQTDLSHEAVEKMFNGMTKSIRRTSTEKLDEEIKKVNKKFKSKEEEQKKVENKFDTAQMFAGLGGLIFLILTAMQTYCSLYDCAGRATFKLPQLPQHNNGYYSYGSRNNYFITPI